MNLDKNKFYCQSCLKDGKITELYESIYDKNILEVSCKHKGRYFSYMSWCNECKDFTSHRGISKNAICYRCIMKKNCKMAINKGLHSSQNPETSLSNPKIHAKTIRSQIENGSFNMMNSKTYKKAMKNKMEKYSSGLLKCNKCGKENQILNAFGICSKCQSKIAIKNRTPKYCNSCKEITPHNGIFCLICHPQSQSNVNVQSFTIKDNTLYYFDKSSNRYIPWKDYVEKFKIIDVIIPNGFELYPTFRIQDSADWTSARQAFEYSLVENNINWFIYIKFFIDHLGYIKPLVIGKSGSLNVNTNGSDVSFSTDINDGPARRFLNEEGLQWCKTQIAILKCNSEEEAYEKEKYFSKYLNLFGS